MKQRWTTAMAGLVAAILPAWHSGVTAADAVPVLGLEKICAHEKWKKVAFDAYFDLQKINCRGSRNKRSNKIINGECSIAVHGGGKDNTARFIAWIKVTDEPQANKMFWPADKFKAEDLKIYDNAGKLLPARQKLRIAGSRRNLDQCEFGVDQIDVAK